MMEETMGKMEKKERDPVRDESDHRRLNMGQWIQPDDVWSELSWR